MSVFWNSGHWVGNGLAQRCAIMFDQCRKRQSDDRKCTKMTLEVGG